MACLRPFLTSTYSSTMPPFKRAGAIERIGGDDVGEPVRLHLDQEVADAGRFELKDALRSRRAARARRSWGRPGGDGRGRSGLRDVAG